MQEVDLEWQMDIIDANSEGSSRNNTKVLYWTEVNGMGITTSCAKTVLYFTELCHKSQYYLKCLIALPLPAELGYCSSSSVYVGFRWPCVEISRSVSCWKSTAVRTMEDSTLTMLYICHCYSTVSVCHRGDGKWKFMHSLTVVSLLFLSNSFTSNQLFFSLHWTDAKCPKKNGKNKQ